MAGGKLAHSGFREPRPDLGMCLWDPAAEASCQESGRHLISDTGVKQSVVASLQWWRLSLFSQLYLVVAGTSSCQVVEVSAVTTRLELQSSRALVAWRQSESPLIIAQVPAEVARPAAASLM